MCQGKRLGDTEDDWPMVSSQLDNAAPSTVTGQGAAYKLGIRLDRNGAPGKIPRSQSFTARRKGSNDWFHIKFAPAASINREWDAISQIPESPYLHRPCDRSHVFRLDPDSNSPFHFIVSPLLAGKDLYQVFDAFWTGGERYQTELLLAQLQQALVGLAHLHAAGRVHCDIKPDNIFWTDDGRLWFLDFEYSIAAGAPQTGRTPDYAAPEAEIGRPATYSSDVYSLAITFLVLWKGVNARDMKRLVACGRVMDTRSEWGDVLREMARLQPEDRLTCAQAAERLNVDLEIAKQGGD
jgi:serine/threonine protein kinase